MRRKRRREAVRAEGAGGRERSWRSRLGVREYGRDQSDLYYRERGRKLDSELVVLFHRRNDAIDNTILHEMLRPYRKAALAPAPDGTFFDHSAMFSFFTVSIPWDGVLLQRLYHVADPRERLPVRDGASSA